MEKKWPEDLLDRLHPDKIESYTAMKDAILELKALLQYAGLGSLKMEKKIAAMLYEA